MPLLTEAVEGYAITDDRADQMRAERTLHQILGDLEHIEGAVLCSKRDSRVDQRSLPSGSRHPSGYDLPLDEDPRLRSLTADQA